jgi:hypothetical protein
MQFLRDFFLRETTGEIYTSVNLMNLDDHSEESRSDGAARADRLYSARHRPD